MSDTTVLTDQDRADLCICVSPNQHDDAPSSACPLLIASETVERIITRHLGMNERPAWWSEGMPQPPSEPS